MTPWFLSRGSEPRDRLEQQTAQILQVAIVGNHQVYLSGHLVVSDTEQQSRCAVFVDRDLSPFAESIAGDLADPLAGYHSISLLILRYALSVKIWQVIGELRDYERTRGLDRKHLHDLSKILLDALARERVAPDLKSTGERFPCIECGERIAVQYVLSISQMCNRCAAQISGKVGGNVSPLVKLLPTDRQLKAAAAAITAKPLQLPTGKPIDGEYV